MDDLTHLLEVNPSLTSLNLEFSEIDSLEALLPWLEQFTELEELLLFGNRLESLPRNLSSLQQLQKLDISNNIFSSTESFLPGLLSLSKLSELSITIQTEEQEQSILTNLPRLKSLNGAPVAKRALELPAGLHALQQQDLEQVAVLYDSIREKWRELDESADATLAQDFDSHVSATINDLAVAMHQECPTQVLQTHMLCAKQSLFSICQEKLSVLANVYDPKLAEMLDEANCIMSKLFEDLAQVAAAVRPPLGKDNELQKHREEKEKLRQSLVQEREEMRFEIESLQEENKKYLELIIKHSKKNARALLDGNPETRSPENSKLNYSAANACSAQSLRTLSLRQVKETIEEIYTSKAKSDQRCTDGKLPRETMEQHMYTYLNHKYGLKSLTLEWASSLIAAVKQYASEDNDIAVFGKILRSECDEEFRFVQLQVKETVCELLKMHLKAKYPLKTSSDINELQREKSEGFINEEEWADIVRYMYNEADAELLIHLVFKVVELKRYPSELPPVRGKLTREENFLRKEREKQGRSRIAFSDFLKILLDFQLKGHEKFLAQFLSLFRRVDRDANGIVDEREFRELVASMGVNSSEYEIFRLLQSVDPYENQAVTFSECVSLFSIEQVPLDELCPGDTVAVLQKLALSKDFP